jgi:hypothetical protein
MLVVDAGVFPLYFSWMFALKPACAATGALAHLVAVPKNGATIPNTHAR